MYHVCMILLWGLLRMYFCDGDVASCIQGSFIASICTATNCGAIVVVVVVVVVVVAVSAIFAGFKT